MASAFGSSEASSWTGRLSRSVALAIALQIVGAAPVRAQGAELEAVPGTPTDSSAVAGEGDEASATQDSNTAAPWYERLQFSGDFRVRYEGFYQRGRQTRNRARLRLRLRVDTEINEDVRFQLQVASGDPGTPDSTNQTFTSFFRPKPFNLDLAYIAYNPLAASAITLGLGKFPPTFTRTQMTFDDDLNYEGGWEQVEWNPIDGIGVNLVALQAAVNEVSRGDDSYMFAGYGAVTFDMGAHTLQVSAANYGWSNVDQIAVAQASGVLTSSLTNEVVRDEDGNIAGFASRFNVVDIISEATFQTSKADYPLRFLAEFAHNTRAASERDSGFWVEAEYGRPRRAGTWGAAYTYGWIGQDVTLSAFVFSDMPGTNLRLHMIETSYVPKAGLSLDFTLHLSRRLFLPEDTPNYLLTRLHVAAVVRF